jgi:spore maturation protein SpmB
MKKLFFFIALCFSLLAVKGQTLPEINKILNAPPRLIQSTPASSLDANLLNIDLNDAGYKLVSASIEGTWVATISFEGSNNNISWWSVGAYKANDPGNFVTSTTINGHFLIPTLGFRYIRVRVSAYTSGSATSTFLGFLNNVYFPTAVGAGGGGGSPLTDAQLRATPVLVGISKINSTTISTGNGAVDAGVIRVAVASNNTPFTVNAAQSGAWNVGQSGVWNVGQSGTWNVGITGAVSLPTNASTESTLSTISSKLGTLGQSTMAGSAPVVIASNQSAIPVSLSAGSNLVGSVKLTDGTNTADVLNTAPVSDVGQKGIAVRVISQLGAGGGGGGSGSDVQYLHGAASGSPTGTLALGYDGANLRGLKTDASGVLSTSANQSGTWNLNNISGTISLPTGASTESTLSGLSAKFGALGQTTMTGSAPVVIASNQSAIPVSGSVSIQANASVNVAQINGITTLMGNGITGTGSQRVTIASDNTAFGVNANQSGTWNLNNISGTISLPTGASTESTLSGLSAKFGALGQTTMTGSAPVVIASNQSAIPVSGSVSIQANASVNVAQINGITTLMGNGITGTGSQRVTIASDNTAFGVNANQSGTWNLNNISGTISLPTGASTESTLSGLSAKFGALGQTTMTGSAPVVIASNQSAIPVSGSVSIQANASVNVAQINGITTLMGNGITGTGSQRVTIASDNTAFGVNANQSGTWNLNRIFQGPFLFQQALRLNQHFRDSRQSLERWDKLL